MERLRGLVGWVLFFAVSAAPALTCGFGMRLAGCQGGGGTSALEDGYVPGGAPWPLAP